MTRIVPSDIARLELAGANRHEIETLRLLQARLPHSRSELWLRGPDLNSSLFASDEDRGRQRCAALETGRALNLFSGYSEAPDAQAV